MMRSLLLLRERGPQQREEIVSLENAGMETMQMMRTCLPLQVIEWKGEKSPLFGTNFQLLSYVLM